MCGNLGPHHRLVTEGYWFRLDQMTFSNQGIVHRLCSGLVLLNLKLNLKTGNSKEQKTTRISHLTPCSATPAPEAGARWQRIPLVKHREGGKSQGAC